MGSVRWGPWVAVMLVGVLACLILAPSIIPRGQLAAAITSSAPDIPPTHHKSTDGNVVAPRAVAAERRLQEAHFKQAEPFISYQQAMTYAKPFTESYPKVVNRTARLIDFRASLGTLVKTVRGQLSGRLPVMDAARMAVKVDDRLPAAVFTIVMNEPIYLKAWLAHYNKTFLPKDMYVMDNNGGRDGTTGGLAAMGINVVMARCDHSYLDHQCILSYVSTMSRLLLSTYRVVVYTDVDELIYSTAPGLSLWDYLCHFRNGTVRTDTRTPAESPVPFTDVDGSTRVRSNSPPFNWNLDPSAGGGRMAAQRRHWYTDIGYAKTLVHTRPLAWVYGYHGAALEEPLTFNTTTGRVNPIALPHLDGGQFGKGRLANRRRRHVMELDPTLMLLHIHRIDKAYFLHRQQWKGTHKRTLGGRLGWFARPNETKFDNMYWGPVVNGSLTLIPASWAAIEAEHLSQQPTGRCP